jgi:hypothetical protein
MDGDEYGGYEDEFDKDHVERSTNDYSEDIAVEETRSIDRQKKRRTRRKRNRR